MSDDIKAAMLVAPHIGHIALQGLVFRRDHPFGALENACLVFLEEVMQQTGCNPQLVGDLRGAERGALFDKVEVIVHLGFVLAYDVLQSANLLSLAFDDLLAILEALKAR